jgi:hypothetical protein
MSEMNLMVNAIKEKMGPGGDLYLTKTHVEHLLRWLEICEGVFKEYKISLGVIADALEALEVLNGGKDAQITTMLADLKRLTRER